MSSGGWAAQILRSGWSSDWEQAAVREVIDMAAVRTWAYGPGGPLAAVPSVDKRP